MRIRRTDRKQLATLLQLDLKRADQRLVQRLDGVDVDDRAAVDLPEDVRIELGEQFLDRFANDRFLFLCIDQRVLVVRLEVEDLIDGDKAYVRAFGRVDPT